MRTLGLIGASAFLACATLLSGEGEALACGVPCVATDVGDSREIVSGDGVVVPIGDADGVAAGWASLLRRSPAEREAMASRARTRAVDLFDITMVSRRYWAEQEAGMQEAGMTTAVRKTPVVLP